MSALAAAIGNDKDRTAYAGKYDAAMANMYSYYWDPKAQLFVDPGGQLSVQTSNALALSVGVLNDTTEIANCAANLAKDVTVTHNHHIGTGIVGTKAIWPQLCRYGYCDVALNASVQRTMPGYGSWVMQGATTLWEHWQATKYNSSQCAGIGTKNHISSVSVTIKTNENKHFWYSVWRAGRLVLFGVGRHSVAQIELG